MNAGIALEQTSIQVAQTLWGKLSAEQKADYMTLVYRILLNAHPEYKPLFPTDLEPVRDNMTEIINYLMQHLQQPEKIQAVFKCLGAKHYELKITAEMYPHMVSCKVEALNEFFGGALSKEELAHWRKVMGFLGNGILLAYPS